MPAAREDKRFAIGFAVVLAMLAVYVVAVRAPLRSATARAELEARKAKPDVDRYFRNPKATPFTRVHDELASRKRALDERLATLAHRVEFDPEPLDPTGQSADLPGLYWKLSKKLHEDIRTKAEAAPHLVRVPAIFDPQGEIQTPSDPARIPRLHRQLVMAHRILRAAIKHRVDIVGLRAPTPRIEAVQQKRYLDRVRVSVKAQATLDALAALVHELGQPPQGGADSTFLSVGALEVTSNDDDPTKVAHEITFVSVRIHPTTRLVGGKPTKPTSPTRRRPPRRAPRF